MSTDAIEIRRAVATARRAFPQVDFDNYANVLIKNDASLALAKAVLFEEIVAHAAPPNIAVFRRARLADVFSANRRRA